MAFRFETLDIWKQANDFTLQIYSVVKTFPKEERYALSDQLRRSASSIPANIAEGSRSSSKKDFCHYLDISVKSVYETVSQIYLANRLDYITKNTQQSVYKDAENLTKRIKSFQTWLKNNSMP